MIKMYMDSVTEAYKNKITERVARRLADAVKNGEVTMDELPEVSAYVLDNIDKATNNSELLTFLEELGQKYSFFAQLLTAEKVEEVEQNKQEALTEASSLLNQNKIDEALKVVTDANNQKTGGLN
jgi:vesicle coat complex subunit